MAGTPGAASSGTPVLPPASYATVPGGDVPLFKSGSTTNYATDVKDVFNSTSTNILWELDGYSAYVGGSLDTSGTGGVPKVWTQVDYQRHRLSIQRLHPRAGLLRQDFFHLAARSTQYHHPNHQALQSYFNLLGISSTSDQTYLANNWNTWLGQGTSTGLTNLQNWLTGSTTNGGPYTTTSKFVTGSNNKAPIYYAVCRLFNRAYPAGSSNGKFSADWRLRFFGTDNNPALLNSNDSLDLPGSGTYQINYNAFLTWIAQSPNPFPTQLRAGCVKYYGSIPTAITGTWPSYGSTDQRFWVEFIDHVLGFRQTSAGVYQDVSGMAGYGSDFSWGTISISNTVPALGSSNLT